jgi:hypothetical protein
VIEDVAITTDTRVARASLAPRSRLWPRDLHRVQHLLAYRGIYAARAYSADAASASPVCVELGMQPDGELRWLARGGRRHGLVMATRDEREDTATLLDRRLDRECGIKVGVAVVHEMSLGAHRRPTYQPAGV